MRYFVPGSISTQCYSLIYGVNVVWGMMDMQCGFIFDLSNSNCTISLHPGSLRKRYVCLLLGCWFASLHGSGRSNVGHEPGAGQMEVFYLFSLVLCRFLGKNTSGAPAGVHMCLCMSAHLVGMPTQVTLQRYRGDFGRAPNLGGGHEEMDSGQAEMS